MTHTGFYVQGMYALGEFFLVGRYGQFSPDEEGAEDVTRISIGGGWIVREGVEFRLEYQSNSEEDDDVTLLQCVVGF